MAQKWTFSFVALIFLTGSGWLGYGVQQHIRAYRAAREAYAEKMDYKRRLADLAAWFGDGKDKSDEAELETLKAEMENASSKAGMLAVFWGVVAVIFAIFSWLFARRAGNTVWLKTGLLLIALACLYPGLSAPMLEISAYEQNLEIPIKLKTSFFSLDIDKTQVFEGEMYFYYQSKSVLELIGLLFRQHNWLVGVSILLFSVLIPVGKTGLSIWSALSRRMPKSGLLRWLMLRAGKWSMADVFVVAVFLAFLAFNNMQAGIETQSRILPGMYFFMAYVLIAVGVSSLMTGTSPDENV